MEKEKFASLEQVRKIRDGLPVIYEELIERAQAIIDKITSDRDYRADLEKLEAEHPELFL